MNKSYMYNRSHVTMYNVYISWNLRGYADSNKFYLESSIIQKNCTNRNVSRYVHIRLVHDDIFSLLLTFSSKIITYVGYGL